MKDLVTPIEKIKEYAQEIQLFLSQEPSDNPGVTAEYGDTCAAYMALTGKLQADARYHLNQKKKNETMGIIDTILKKSHISAKVQNSLIDSICKDEQYLFEWIERLNKACTHQLDWCRSKLSYAKEEMRIAQ